MRELFVGRRGRIAAGLLVSEFVMATQGLVIAAIMPRVVADLGGLGQYALAFGSFFAAFLCVLPFAGPWADRYGLRRMLTIALGLLGAGLALVALAPNMTAFVGARFVEGIGDGLDYAVSFTIVAKSFPEGLRSRMLSLSSAMWVLPGLVAPALGAYVATTVGWRWAFAGMLPLLAVAAALILPGVDARATGENSHPYGALHLLFSRATLQARSGLHASFVAFGLLHAAFFGADAYVALALTSVRGLSLEAASVCITLAVLGWSSTAALTAELSARWSVARVVMLGAVASVLATASLATVVLGGPIGLAFAAWFVGGAGVGLSYPTLSAAILGAAEAGREGAVSSAMALAAILGILVGVLLCGLPVSIAAHSGMTLRVALAATFGCATLFGAALIAATPQLKRA
ncbi:MAG TPA: MFS transporter [Candidatus Baltobacteraceae bacterium]|nr:MFS transporter [Candidatus Baltobacteraceae bacterium]